VAKLCSQVPCRVGGGVRDVHRLRQLVDAGARQVILGTAAFSENGINDRFLRAARRAVGKSNIIVALDTSRGRIVVRGWRARTGLRAEEVIAALEPFCAGF